MATKPQAVARDPQADVAAVAGQIAAAENKLRAALLQGADTSAIRADLTKLKAKQAEATALIEQQDQQRAAEAAAVISGEAERIAAAVNGRIDSALDDLQPPAAPTGVR